MMHPSGGDLTYGEEEVLGSGPRCGTDGLGQFA